MVGFHHTGYGKHSTGRSIVHRGNRLLCQLSWQIFRKVPGSDSVGPGGASSRCNVGEGTPHFDVRKDWLSIVFYQRLLIVSYVLRRCRICRFPRAAGLAFVSRFTSSSCRLLAYFQTARKADYTSRRSSTISTSPSWRTLTAQRSIKVNRQGRHQQRQHQHDRINARTSAESSAPRFQARPNP